MARFDLTDEEWAAIEPLLPKGGRGPKRKDDRRVLNGMFYILRSPAFIWMGVIGAVRLGCVPNLID